MASTTDNTRGSLQLLPGLIGFIFAFRICLTILWFQNEPQQASMLSVALSFLLLIAAGFFSIGEAPSAPTSCFRTSTIRLSATFLGFALLSILWTPAPLSAAAAYWCAWASDVATIWLILRDGPPEASAAALMKGFVWGSCLVAVVAWSLPATQD